MANTTIFGGALAAFIVVIIGLTLLSTSSDTIAGTTEIQSNSGGFSLIENEAVSILPETTDTIVSVTNVSAAGIDLAVSDNYTVDLTAGTINITDSGLNNRTYNVSYTYTKTDYVDSGSTRSVIALIKIMFALAVFLSAAAFIDWRSFGMK